MMHRLVSQHISDQVQLPVAAILKTLDLSRATHYRHRATAPEPDPDTQLRDHIQRVALDWPCYGYRRISAELHRQGITGLCTKAAQKLILHKKSQSCLCT